MNDHRPAREHPVVRCPVLVGRTSELGALDDALQRARAGEGSWVNVVGEAGIGKSRLVSAFAGSVAAAGGTAVTGRCSTVDRSTAYRPLAEAALALAARLPDPLPAELEPYAAAVARFVPKWSSRDVVANESPAVLGESILRLVRACGAGRPAALILEDLHWADTETLAVSEYLADHVGDAAVVIVSTWRPEDAATSSRRPFGRRTTLPLAPLSPAEVAEVVAACRGQAPATGMQARLVEASGGLPLLVEDLLDDDAPAPVRFSALVAERLARVPDWAVPVVAAAALLGERFELPLLDASLGDRPVDAARALQEAIAAGLVTVDDGSFRFRHALTHEAVLLAAPAARVAMSGPVAAALEATCTARNVVRAAELRAAVGESAAAAALFEQAAELVDREGTPGAALALLDRASELVIEPARRRRIDLSRLSHLAALGRADDVERLGSVLLDSAAGDADPSVRLTLARACLDAGHPDRAVAHLDAVTGLAPDHPVRLVLRARLGLLSDRGDRRVVAEHLAHQAIAAAEADAPTICEALELAARCARNRSLGDAGALLRRALAIAEESGLTAWRLRVLNEIGTVEMLQFADGARLARARDAALAAGALDVAVATSVNLSALHAMRGELDATRTSARVAHDDAIRLGLRPLAAAALVMEGLSYGFRGERDEMERRFRSARELAPTDDDLDAFSWGAGRGLCALMREERADAVRAFRRGVQDDIPLGSLDAARAPLFLVLAVSGEAREADRDAARAAATPGAGWSDLWLGYAEAVVAGGRRDAEGASAAFAGADEAGRRHPLFRAIALRLVSEAALRDGWGDPVGWLREAEGVFVAGGQARIAGACRALLKKAGVAATRRRGADRDLAGGLLRAGVTAREAEVLTLIGDRLSNKEIAARLYLSPRTVEKHVASLMLKLGAGDRSTLSQVARSVLT